MATAMCVRSVRAVVRRNIFGGNSVRRFKYSTTVSDANEKQETVTDENLPTSPESKEETGPAEIELKLKEDIKKLENDCKDLKDKYVRSIAETENVRQRMRKQIDDAKLFGIQGFCKDLLEVADVLGQATHSVPKEELTDNNPHLKNLFEGLTMTESQLQKVFNKYGLVQISPKEGDKFDPHLHEAMFQVPTKDADSASKIATVTKIGYSLRDRTLRPALVGVFKA